VHSRTTGWRLIVSRMSTSVERAGSVHQSHRVLAVLRRLTAGIALSAAAVTAGLAGLPASAAHLSASTTDQSRSTTVAVEDTYSDWGVASAPQHAPGPSAHTVSSGW
jgi:hypothetical protein